MLTWCPGLLIEGYTNTQSIGESNLGRFELFPLIFSMANNLNEFSASDIVHALIREHLHVYGYTQTQKVFQEEAKSSSLKNISSRRDLSYLLGIRKNIESNRKKGIMSITHSKDSPLKSQFEILIDKITTQLTMNRAAKKSLLDLGQKLKETSLSDKQDGSFNTVIPRQIPNETRRPVSEKDIEIVEDLDISDDEEFIPTSRVQPLSRTASQSQLQWSPSDEQNVIKILFPAGIKDFSPEWKGKGFHFQQKEDLSYGLVQSKGGPCGLLASLQGWILKEMLSAKEFIRFP
jgi:hypothetical protein